MCKLAIGYHHICPPRMAGASKGGCGHKFFLALEILSEWKWMEQVMKKGGEPGNAAVRECLKAKAIHKGKDWSRYSGRSLEKLRDRLACDSDKHSVDRWDQWAPTHQESLEQGVNAKVFRRYCSDCELLIHPSSRDRMPNSQDLPEDLDYTKVPPFQVGEMPFDDPDFKYVPTDDDEWLAPKDSSETGVEETGSETTQGGESTSRVSSEFSRSRRSSSAASGGSRSSVSATSGGGTRSSISMAASGVSNISSSFVSFMAPSRPLTVPTPPPSGITNPYQLNLPTRRRRQSSALLSEASRGESLTSVGEEDEDSGCDDDGQTESSTARSTSTATERPRRARSPATDMQRGRRRY